LTVRPWALLAVALLAAPLLGGCGNNPDAVPAHTAQEQKLIDEMKSLTPQQQIERIQKGPMPESAKAATIQKIKDANGIK